MKLFPYSLLALGWLSYLMPPLLEIKKMNSKKVCYFWFAIFLQNVFVFSDSQGKKIMFPLVGVLFC